MSKLPLTIAVSRYDHVNDVLTGAVPVEGIDLNPLDLPLHDIFFRFIHFKDFDVAELSMAKYVSMISRGTTRSSRSRCSPRACRGIRRSTCGATVR